MLATDCFSPSWLEPSSLIEAVDDAVGALGEGLQVAEDVGDVAAWLSASARMASVRYFASPRMPFSWPPAFESCG